MRRIIWTNRTWMYDRMLNSRAVTAGAEADEIAPPFPA